MRENILVIEDDPEVRTLLKKVLTIFDFQFTEAINGKVGLEMALEYLPDLILCDIKMSELDGYGVLYQLKQSPQTFDIPFIFMTAQDERTSFRRGMDMGADDYLTKPFTEQELINAIEIRLKIKKQNLINFQKTKPGNYKNGTSEGGLLLLKKLVQGNKPRLFKKNQTIFYEGDQSQGLYLLKEGLIKAIKIEESGLELITSIYAEGEYIGYRSLLDSEVYSETTVAIEDCFVHIQSKEKLIPIMDNYPEIKVYFMELLSKNIQKKENQLLELAYHSVKKKVAESLLKLYKKTTNPSKCFHISREDLSSMTGVTGETISRTLKILIDEHLIEKKGSLITLISPEKLEKIKN